MSYQIVDYPTPYQWRRPAGDAGRVTWVVIHTDEGSGNPRGAVAFMIRRGKPADQQTGYHELVGGNGVVYRMAYPSSLVGHAGKATRIPGTSVINGNVNNRTIGIAMDNVAEHRPAELAITTCVERVADLIVQLGLADAGVVLSHKEITTAAGRRHDPVGVDMNDFRRQVHDALRRRGR